MIKDLWYKNAIIYSLHVGTYMDSNGDGIGDFEGLSRRLDYLQGLGVTAVATLAHVVAFGWVTRCGVVIPLGFALAYAVARFAGSWLNQLIGLGGIVVLELVMLWRDASIDTVAGALAIALPGIALFYGVGVLVQNRVTKRSGGIAPVHEHTAA